MSIVRFIPHSIQPTNEQLAIQCSQQRISLVEANAGAAKTTTLALRLGEALHRGVAPEQVLALAFTPEARQVLAQRLIELGIAPAVVRKVALYTVEEFAQHMLAFWEESEPLYLSQWHQLKPMALEALEHLSHSQLSHRYAELEIQSHHVALEQFFQSQLRLKAALAVQVDESQSLSEHALIQEVTLSDLLWTQYYERLRQNPYAGVLFRGPFDASYDLAQALMQHPDLLALLPSYRLILVDELHDANEAAFQILRALLNNKNSYLVAAGDTDQVIHHQLAADSSYLRARFEEHFAALRAFSLSVTYRHGPYLAYATGAFAQKKVESVLPLATQIQVHSYPSIAAEPAQAIYPVIQALQRWQQQGGRLEQCAVLLRAEHQSIHLENALLSSGIPYRLAGMRSYLQRDEIAFLRALGALAFNNLATVTNSDDRSQLIQALVLFSEAPINQLLLAEALEELNQSPQLFNAFYQAQIQRITTEHEQGRINQALEYLAQLEPTTPAATALSELVQRVDLVATAKRLYVDRLQAQNIIKSVQAFIAVAAELQLNIVDFYAWCARAPHTLSPSTQAVHLSCVAQAKGKEFEHVLVPYLEQGEFPSMAAHSQVERNLFYVAISRAQKRLSLFVPTAEHLVSHYVKQLQLEQVQPLALQRLQQLQAHNQSASVAANRVDLQVPFSEKDAAKALGARWDPAKRLWYVPAGLNPTPFERWLPTQGHRA